MFEMGDRRLRIVDDRIEILGVGFKPGEDRIGLGPDHYAGLLQGGALVLEARDQGANALFIAPECAFDGGNLLMDDAFEFGCALDRMLERLSE